MGMPGWAQALAVPYALDKVVVDPLTSAYGLYKGIRDDMADKRDKAALSSTMQELQNNPNASIDLARFSDPEAVKSVLKLQTGFQEKQAAPKLSQFANDYTDVAGTVNPRFFADPESRAEMVKAGLKVPEDGGNPYIAKGLQDFTTKAQEADTLTNVFAQGQNNNRIDPDLLASLASDKGLAAQFDNVTQGGKRLFDQANYGKEDPAKVANLAEFAKAQDVAASYLRPNQGSQNRGGYQPAPEVRSDAAAHLSQFTLNPEQRNSINTMLDKGMEDVWVDGRNPYTGKADQEVLSAKREEAAIRRQEIASAQAEARLLKTIEAADRRQGRAIAAADARANKRDDTRRNRPLPASSASALASNSENLRRAETALTLLQGGNIGDIKGDKKAIGWKGYVPDTVLNRVDPTGTSTRAALADLGSMVIHDRSGAAVTASEYPRLKPFIPIDTDDAKTAAKKLELFIRNYRNENDALRSIFKEAGYKLDEGAKAPTPQEAAQELARRRAKK